MCEDDRAPKTPSLPPIRLTRGRTGSFIAIGDAPPIYFSADHDEALREWIRMARAEPKPDH